MTPRGLTSTSFGSPGTPHEHARPGQLTSSAEISRSHPHHTSAGKSGDAETLTTSAHRHRHPGPDHPDDAEPNRPDKPLPVLLGYVCKPLLRTEGELVRTKERMSRFAEKEGFALGKVFVEEETTTPAAFEALIEAASHHEVTAVLVPGMLHLTVLSAPTAMRNQFEHLTGARLLVNGR